MSRSGSPLNLEENVQDDGDISNATYQYIKHLLTEDDAEEEHRTFHDPLALQAMENSFYQVLSESKNHSSSDYQQLLCFKSTTELSRKICDSSGGGGAIGTSTPISLPNDYACRFTAPQNSSLDQHFAQPTFEKSKFISQFFRMAEGGGTFLPPQSLTTSSDGCSSSSSGLMGSSRDSQFALDYLNKSDFILQYERGAEEANRILAHNLQCVPQAVADTGKYHSNCLTSSSTGSQNRHANAKEGSSEKPLAGEAIEEELLVLFERLFLNPYVDGESLKCAYDRNFLIDDMENFPHDIQLPGSLASGKFSLRKRQSNDEEAVELWTPLIQCAHDIAIGDQTMAGKTLKQIRLHSSPSGDGIQRLAHYCANALEARSAGNGPQLYSASKNKRLWQLVNVMKAQQCLASVCPFRLIAHRYAIHSIMKLAETATILHIVVFGISFGFQWAATIYNLSKRPHGPPKLRITGIEDPNPDFGAGQTFQRTGQRLAMLCKRYDVPFEYNRVSKKWDEIQIEDIKTDQNEAIAVAGMLELERLLDEKVDGVCDTMDAVLSLIRKLNPDIFIQFIASGSYNTPLFFRRFRQVVFHYSNLFDMLDTTLPRGSEDRLTIEREFLGLELLNIIACEGSDRVERAETYKQWQDWIRRAGFEQLPLDRELLRKLTAEMKAHYHKGFGIEVDGQWLLQGWNGRILFAFTCWAPSCSTDGFSSNFSDN